MRPGQVALGTSTFFASSTAIVSARGLLPASIGSLSTLPLSGNTSIRSAIGDSPGLFTNAFVRSLNGFPFLPSSTFATSAKQASTMGGAEASKPGQFPKGKSEEEWRTVLSPAQFKVLRQQGTEPGFSHEYGELSKEGVYTCAGCDTPLYKSATKFKSGCGWPAFFDAIPGAVTRKVDKSWGMKRIEIRCAACDSHLGHVFEGEGFPTPTDERHCVNGISLRFNEGDKVEGN